MRAAKLNLFGDQARESSDIPTLNAFSGLLLQFVSNVAQLIEQVLSLGRGT